MAAFAIVLGGSSLLPALRTYGYFNFAAALSRRCHSSCAPMRVDPA